MLGMRIGGERIIIIPPAMVVAEDWATVEHWETTGYNSIHFTVEIRKFKHFNQLAADFVDITGCKLLGFRPQ
jgi:hypothetical protein